MWDLGGFQPPKLPFCRRKAAGKSGKNKPSF